MAAVLLIAAPSASRAQTPPDGKAPVLRINSPFAAPLWRIGIDREETRLVSSSSYKAVTVWPLSDLAAHRILRLPLREEQRRRAHGIALSPDGETIATSVPPLADTNGTPQLGTARIYLVREADGEVAATIDTGISTRPQALAFSPDGVYLAAVLSAGCGLRVWNAKTLALVTGDDEGYGTGGADASQGCGGNEDTTGVVFAGPADAPMLITAGDTGVRAYVFENGAFVRKALAAPSAIGLERPEGLAVSPSGKSIAVGDRRARGAEQSDAPVVLRVAVLNIDSLAPLRQPYELNADSTAIAFPGYLLDFANFPDGRLFSLPRVAWIAEDGEEWIYGGGFFGCEAARKDLRTRPTEGPQDICLVRWSASRPEEEPRFIPQGTDRVMDIAALPKTRAIAVATQKSVAVLDLAGQPLATSDGQPLVNENRAADFRDGARTFSISPDGERVLFEDYASTKDAPVRLLFDAAKLAIETRPETSDAPLAPNQDPNILGEPQSRDPRRSRWWRNTEGPPRFFRDALEDNRLDKDDIYRSAALNLERRIAVVGSSNFLRVIGIGGGPPKILCELPIAEEAYRVNVTPDAAIVVAGHSDGVLRWYRNAAAAGGCRLDLVLSALITRTASGEWTWIAWTPSGEFANDPPAVSLLSWQVVDLQGAVKSVDFSHLLDWYKRDAVAGALAAARRASSPATSPEPRVSSALQDKIAVEAAKQILAIVSKLDRLENERFRFRVRTGPADAWPKTLTVKTGDGHPVAIAPDAATPKSEAQGLKYAVAVVKPGLVEMTLVLPEAARRARSAVSLCFYLDDRLQDCRAAQWMGPLAPPPPRRLWAVIAGFSKYDDPAMRLKYAQNDALDLARSFADDFEDRGAGANPVAPSDFSAVSIDLIVKPTGAELEDEIGELAKASYVKLRTPSREGVLEALGDLVKRGQTQGEDFSGDLFLFYFSGHGFANPYATGRGLTALATPATPSNPSEEDVKRTAITSDDLIGLIEKIPAQKIVIIDACRTAPTLATRQRPFQTGALTQEFQQRSLSTSYLFSAADGQYSIEQADFAFNVARQKTLQGNGLFTYGLLTALRSADADLPDAVDTRNQIDAEEAFRFLRGHIFDLKNPKSVAMRLKSARDGSFAQSPVYDFARPDVRLWKPRHVVLRTLR